MTTTLSPLPILSFRDNNGNALINGQLFTYQAGTQTPAPTYTDSTGATQLSNPIVLNARGEAQVWIPPNTAYKYVLQDSFGNTIWTVDQIVNSQLLTLYGGVDSGTANAYVLNFTANFTSYADGIIVYWTPSNTNTGPSTININGLGPIALVNQDGSALRAGQIAPNLVASLLIKGGQALLLSGAVAQQVLAVDGSNTAPSIALLNDQQTGFFRGASAGEIAVASKGLLVGNLFAVPGHVASFTVTGVTGTITILCAYTLNLNVVTVLFPAFQGAGSGTSFTFTSTQSNLFTPSNSPEWITVPAAQDNGANLYAQVGTVSNQSTNILITFYKNGNASGWVATGNRGLGDAASVAGAYYIPISWVTNGIG
jgi:hypothetical protein